MPKTIKEKHDGESLTANAKLIAQIAARLTGVAQMIPDGETLEIPQDRNRKDGIKFLASYAQAAEDAVRSFLSN